jgi:dolichol-phosphate mannosyltransferase
VYDWFRNITHSLLAVLTALLIIAGLQVIIFGFMGDFVFRGNSEIRKELIMLRMELKELKKERK